MQDSNDRFHPNWSVKSALTFLLHQFIATYGVSFTAPLVFALGFKILFVFGQNYSKRDFYSIVAESPYFPVQIIFALILGWLLGRSLQQKSMLWVWVFPCVILCYKMIATPLPITERASILATSFPGQSLVSHFFGSGCRPQNHCFDQVLITLPFYGSLAYSTGAFLAYIQARHGQPARRKLFWAVASAGSLIILAILIDLIVSLQQTGWNRIYWLILATPVGLGVYVLYVASTIRRQFV